MPSAWRRRAGRGSGDGRAWFQLLFQVKGSTPAPRTYLLRHHGVAALDLFITPVGGKPGTYEAIVDAG